jgi:protein involved in polysaccharide export with SLBB domain
MKKTIYVAAIVAVAFASWGRAQDFGEQTSGAEALKSRMLISATIGGSFLATGTFPGFVGERVDQYVTRIFYEARQNMLASQVATGELLRTLSDVERFGFRNITLKRAAGGERTVDLAMFRATGDQAHNPYIKNDDVLLFPAVDMDLGFFKITGAINRPGKYQYVPGDDLQTAITLALGYHAAYVRPDSVEIARLDFAGEELTIKRYGADDNPTLEPGDRIRVFAPEPQRKDFAAQVLGYVASPGAVPITRNATSVAEAIELAGGFLPRARPSRVMLFRSQNLPLNFLKEEFGVDYDPETPTTPDEQMALAESLERATYFQYLEFRRLSNVTELDSAYLRLETALQTTFNGQVVDCREGNLDKARRVLLEDGDIVVAPKFDSSVTVFGQVPRPGKTPYREGATAFDYIADAGGTTDYSSDDIMVIREGDGAWIEADEETVVAPGDMVWVPKDPERSFNYYLTQTGTLLSIVSSLATITLLILQFSE